MTPGSPFGDGWGAAVRDGVGVQQEVVDLALGLETITLPHVAWTCLCSGVWGQVVLPWQLHTSPCRAWLGRVGRLSGDRYCLSLNLGTLALDPHLTVEQIC